MFRQPLLTPREVANILKVSYDTALSFIKYSGIDYIVIGRQYRVYEDKLREFLSKKGRIFIDLTEEPWFISIYNN